MKQSIFKLSLFFLAMASFIACSDDDSAPIVDDDPVSFAELEDEWVRLTLLQEDKIETMQAASEEIIGFVDTGLPQGSRYYSSNSGRYLTVINTGANETRFFDTGVVNHVDHGHQNQVRWLDLTLQTSVPVHYTSVNGNIVIFNDGDGSITYVEEEQLELPAYTPMTMRLENTVGHHGVGIRLDSGKFAVTFQSDTAPDDERLPQMVKYVTSDGTVIDDNGGVVVGRIHGSANNGSYGAFGSTDGVIVVDNQDNIDLIPNSDDSLRNERGFWIGTLKSHENSELFYGRASNLGIYTINPEQKSMSLLYEGGNVENDMFSFNGEFYLLHTDDGRIRVYDANTSDLITERVVEMADIPDSPITTAKSANSEMAQLQQEQEQESPVLICSDKFLYVLAPNRTQIKVLEIDELKHVHTIELDTPVQSIVKNGFSIEGEQHGDHNH
ncbi:hypothetical protein L0P88_09310 [Muricauda sp. SCSIO 64092]|uniref:hypothetical protein n=1 Tax=Allomuricauda sp. SCSIO 64092 TaxID=2908842 RepID=UPI001FF41A43|nr:hypothetical protein [Muricauda sp. SCSIO 64092]UOY08733.1 hypothetical protein L0P88_09310 [Muricauda sp. SCSIO 64092]